MQRLNLLHPFRFHPKISPQKEPLNERKMRGKIFSFFCVERFTFLAKVMVCQGEAKSEEESSNLEFSKIRGTLVSFREIKRS